MQYSAGGRQSASSFSAGIDERPRHGCSGRARVEASNGGRVRGHRDRVRQPDQELRQRHRRRRVRHGIHLLLSQTSLHGGTPVA